jgi:hypothetical protein
MRFIVVASMLLTSAGLLLASQDANAFAGRVDDVPNGSAFACSLCHISPGGAGPRTAFGEQVKETAVGPNADWGAIFNLDADEDGFTNGEELGDPTGTWVSGDPDPELLSDPNDPESTPEVPENNGNNVNNVNNVNNADNNVNNADNNVNNTGNNANNVSTNNSAVENNGNNVSTNNSAVENNGNNAGAGNNSGGENNGSEDGGDDSASEDDGCAVAAGRDAGVALPGALLLGLLALARRRRA